MKPVAPHALCGEVARQGELLGSAGCALWKAVSKQAICRILGAAARIALIALIAAMWCG
jgi:hypothetical protein